MMSVDLIKRISRMPDHMSKVVILWKVEADKDGVKKLYVKSEGEM